MKLKPWIPRVSPKSELGHQSPVFLPVTKIIGPAYARFVLGLRRITIEGEDRLVEEYRRAARDEGRFVVAYLHPGDSDPHLVFHALTNLIAGRAPATAEDGRPGAWYPSGAEVPLWASPLVRWALRNAGIVPVRHGAVDRKTIDYLVGGVAERRRPMAIAPEGQATFHQDLVAELDPGTARIACMAAERLEGSGMAIGVRILPLALCYSYGRTTSPARLGRFIDALEFRVGLPGPTLDAEGVSLSSLKARLLVVWERLVASAESGYRRAWGIVPASIGSGLRERTVTLLEASIARLESFYGVPPGPTLKARILNIRAESLRRVFYEPKELGGLSPLESGMANRGAAEAFYLDKIYLVAGLAQFLDPAYLEVPDSPGILFDRLVETAQNLHDFANRLEGLGLADRTHYFRKDVRISVGEPIEAKRREGEGRREAAERVQKELEAGLAKLLRS